MKNAFHNAFLKLVEMLKGLFGWFMSLRWQFKLVIISILLSPFILYMVGYGVFMWRFNHHVDDTDKYVREFENIKESTLANVRDNEGRPIGSLQTTDELTDNFRLGTSSEDIEFADRTIVTAEDRQYWERDGSIEFWRFLLAIFKKRGGSTIPAQAAKQILNDYEDSVDRNIRGSQFGWKKKLLLLDRKIREFALGEQLINWGGIDKGREETLRYLANYTYTGPHTRGIAAAKHRFCTNIVEIEGKPQIKQMKCEALLGTIFNGFGTYYNAKEGWNAQKTLSKRNLLIDAVVARGKFGYTAEDAELAKSDTTLPRIEWPENNISQPRNFLSLIQAELLRSGWEKSKLPMLDISTQYRADIQEQTLNLVQQTVENFRAKGYAPPGYEIHGSAVVMDDKGKVLSFVGRELYELTNANGGQVSYGGQQVALGSVIKILVYALAFDYGWDPNDLIPDIPLNGCGSNNEKLKASSYCPGSIGGFSGKTMPLWWHFANSKNTSAARLLYRLKKPSGWQQGTDPMLYEGDSGENVKIFETKLLNMGMKVPKEAGPSLALGIAEGSLYDVARATAVVYQEGMFKPLVPWDSTLCGSPNCSSGNPTLKTFRYCKAESAEKLKMMMGKVVEMGTATILQSPEYSTEAKTGSSMKAAWVTSRTGEIYIIARLGLVPTEETLKNISTCYKARKDSGCKGRACLSICTIPKQPHFKVYGSIGAAPIVKGLLDWMSTHELYSTMVTGQRVVMSETATTQRPVANGDPEEGPMEDVEPDN